MSPLAEVKTIYESNMRDIPGMAEKLAKDIREGVYGETRSIIAIVEKADGQLALFGWGETGLLETLGLLQLASAELVEMRKAATR